MTAPLPGLWLQEIPQIAIEILKNRHGPVRLLPGRPNELNPSCSITLVISPEIIGVQEQKNPASRLCADSGPLLGRRCPGQQPSVDTSNPAKRGRRKTGHRGGRSSGCVVARSLLRAQGVFSGDTTIAPPPRSWR